MPQNSLLGQPAILQDVSAQAAFFFSDADTYAMIKRIPAGGTTVTLPANPSSGDYYELADTDGSCGSTSPIIVVPGNAAQSIHGGLSSISFAGPFAWAWAVYDEGISDWVIYSGSAGPGGGSVLQAVWFVDNINGSDNNTGLTALTPVKTYAAIGSRWRGGQKGIRPQLPVSTTITILQGYATTAAAKVDPLSVLLDVDLFGSSTLLIQQTTAVLQAGTFTAVGAFARTATGRQTVTSAFTGWGANLDNLIVDMTLGSVAWLNDTAAGPIGVTSAPYTASVIGGGTPDLITLLPFQNGDAFQIVQPLGVVYIGTGSETRQGGRTSAAIGSATVHLYRLREPIETSPLATGDQLGLATDGQARISLIECAINQNPAGQNGIIFTNCAMLGTVTGGTGLTTLISPSPKFQPTTLVPTDCYFKAGYTIAGIIQIEPGASCRFSDDFSMLTRVASNCSITVNPNAVAYVANFGRFGTTAGLPPQGAALICQGKAFCGQGDDNAGPGIFYGATAAGIASWAAQSPEGSIIYAANGGTPAQTTFVMSTSTFTLAASASAYGWNAGTGAYVGATTCTLAHLDTALGAGTGFGNMAIEPASQTRMGLQT